MHSLQQKWLLDKILPPFWVAFKKDTEKIVITAILIEIDKPIQFFSRLISHDGDQEVFELGHLPSERMKIDKS